MGEEKLEDVNKTFDTQDEFNRKQIAEKVIDLLNSDIDISPMVIDGGWGTGKTEFCRKLIHEFEKKHKNYKLVYVDAFQADHADNPLMTILVAVMSLLPDDEERKRNLIQKALPLLRYGTKALLKAGVAHVFKVHSRDIPDEFKAPLQEAANAAIDASVQAALKDHEKLEENLKALHTLLSELAKDAPIVLFVDELDRCRPDFAVQMLELIKHTFNVPRLKFVLVTNLGQLRASINHCYGDLVDAQRYLDKFIKFSFCLPNVVQGGQALAVSIEHFNRLIKQSASLKDTGLDKDLDSPGVVHLFVSQLIECNQLSLREVETLVRHLEIANRLNPNVLRPEGFGPQLLRIFGVFIFCFFPELRDSIRAKQTDAVKFAEKLGVYDETPSLAHINWTDRRLWLDRPCFVLALFLAGGCVHRGASFVSQVKSQLAIHTVRLDQVFDEFNIHSDGANFRNIEIILDCLSLGVRR